MFFTREDIEKIHQGLLRLGIKDSELPETINVNSDDTLAVVQDGKNKKINIEEFFNNISLFKKEGFINITDRFNKHSISLIEAIQTVPTHQRIDGLVITFEDINRDWRIYQFRGDAVDFFDENKWTDLYDYTNYIVKSITPDEEDLTVSKPDKNGNAIVSLKDRVYDESNFSGKGYKILRKNIQTIDGVRKNILTQNMINDPNTVYEIRYDFDLNSETINTPKDCILKFEGGSISNGNINGDSCFLSGNLSNILNNVILKGTYKNLKSNLIWWGVNTKINYDNSDKIQNCFDSDIFYIEVSEKYYISKPVRLPYNKKIEGISRINNKLAGFKCSDTFKGITITLKNKNTYHVTGAFYHTDTTGLEFSDICIDANYKANFCIEHLELYGGVNINNCYLSNALEVGILQYAYEYPIINNVYIIGCKVGIYISSKEYDPNNVFNLEGKYKGTPNLVHLSGLRLLGNNYGIIINGGSNHYIEDLETANNSIVGAFIANTNAIINSYYTENDANCTFWIDSVGNKLSTDSNGKTLQYLIDNNIDGFSTKVNSDKYNKIVYYRAPLVISNSNISINFGFLSVKPRSSENEDVTTISEATERNDGGIDTPILIIRRSIIKATNMTIYSTTNGVGKLPNYGAIEIPLVNYSVTSYIDIMYNNTHNMSVLLDPINSPGLLNNLNSNNLITTDYSLHKPITQDYNIKPLIYGSRKTYTMRDNKYVESFKNIPLFKLSTDIEGYINLDKEQTLDLFKGASQLMFVCVFKVLEQINNKINLSIAFYNNDELLEAYSYDVSGIKTIPANTYYVKQIFNIIDSNKDFTRTLISHNLSDKQDYDKILMSDIYIYDILDTERKVPTIPFLLKGVSENRPTLTNLDDGFEYYDSTLKKKILWNGTEWTNMDGTTL